MYHIANDKRARRSADLISESLMRLVVEKDFANVTITDIQRESGVGRATFYRLFDNTADVLLYLIDQIMDRTLEHQRRCGQRGAREATLFFIREWIRNRDLLRTVVRSGHLDIVYLSFQTHAEAAGDLTFSGLDCPPEQKDYIVSIMATAMAGGLQAWVLHGECETAEQVYDLLRGSVDAFYLMAHRG